MADIKRELDLRAPFPQELEDGTLVTWPDVIAAAIVLQKTQRDKYRDLALLAYEVAEGRTLDAIGKDLKVSRERARQLAWKIEYAVEAYVIGRIPEKWGTRMTNTWLAEVAKAGVKS